MQSERRKKGGKCKRKESMRNYRGRIDEKEKIKEKRYLDTTLGVNFGPSQEGKGAVHFCPYVDPPRLIN